MAFFRGMDGSFAVGGVVLAQLDGWSLQIGLQQLDTTSMGDAWESCVGGVGNWSGKASAKIDATSAGQQTLINAFLTANPAGGTAALEFRVTGSTKKMSGNALCYGISVEQTMGQITKISFDVKGSGAILPTWT